MNSSLPRERPLRRPPEVLCVGEALIDWVCPQRGADLDAATHFVKAPGGAPLNVAIGLARLGVEVGFAGCLADDPFGASLGQLIAREGMDASRVRVVPRRQTRMAYVITDGQGDRQLAMFSTLAPADAELDRADLRLDPSNNPPFFYFGSLILLAPGPRAAVLEAAAAVKAAGGLVVFDPNVRPVLWPDTVDLQAALRAGLAACSLLKLSVDEWDTFPSEGLSPGDLREQLGLAAVVVTRGANGSRAFCAAGVASATAKSIAVVDTTGAGDGFVASLIADGAFAHKTGEGLAKPHARVAAWSTTEWQQALERANAVGALVCSQSGAIAGLPTGPERDAFLHGRPG